MIAYVDTSALVPLVVDEPSSAACRRAWSDADAVLTSRLAYVEAAAAIAMAERLARTTRSKADMALSAFRELWSTVAVVEVDQRQSELAAQLARRHALRGYDAVHCAAALSVVDDEMVAVAGDQRLLGAWRAEGLSTFDVND